MRPARRWWLAAALAAGCSGQGPRPPPPPAEIPREQAASPQASGSSVGPPLGGFATTPQIVAGPTYACGLSGAGRVVCWGTGAQGQLGDGLADPSPRPAHELPLSRVQRIAAGASHACALLDGGEVHCWGSNQRGQLGQPARDGRVYAPTRVPLPAAVDRLADAPLCALADGDAYCWGDAPRQEKESPRLDGLPSLRALSVGDEQSCAVSVEAEVLCWSDSKPAAKVPLPSLITDVSARGNLGCALGSQRAVFCWGDWPRQASGMIKNLPDATQVKVSDGIGCALRAAGTVACWGDLLRGGPWSWDLSRIAPQGEEAAEVPGVGGVVDLALGRGFSCALRGDGHVLCWGANDAGVSGAGSADPPFIAPRVVPGVNLLP